MKKPSPRPLWLIPILMLILAAIACDDLVMYDTVGVERVVADADTPGRAYAWLSHHVSEINSERSLRGQYLYVTDDYGANWSPAEGDLPEAEVQALPLTMSGETLELDTVALWQFPRPQFRYFFYEPDDTVVKYFQLPYQPSNSVQGDVLYVAMGTEGVLVGPAPDSASPRAWTLTNNGMSELRPLALTITEPNEIVGIILLALLVPPLPILHAYLLSRVWAYVLPTQRAWRYALIFSLGQAVVAAIAIVIWLTQISVEYFPMVAVVTALVVIQGVAATGLLATRAGVTAYTRSRLLTAAALVSLIVPAGVAAIWTGWWAVGLLLIGYACLSYLSRYYLEKYGVITTPLKNESRWHIDRLAIEGVLIGVVTLTFGSFGIFTLLASVLSRMFDSNGMWTWIQPILQVGLLIVGAWLINRRIISRSRQLANIDPDDAPRPMWARAALSVLAWAFIAAVFAGGVFGLQAGAYDWFTTLITP
jgi:hypothetical protein